MSLVPQSGFGFKQKIADFPNSTLSTGAICHVGRDFLHSIRAICNCDRHANSLHQAKVRQVVADMDHIIQVDAEIIADFLQFL